ncbi:MAG TPA: hypothetical protein VFJ57_10375 [Solirubrobacterales bacterium]|nr:hypothetical protein [Solirubrobacterales bacterium]
MRAVRVGVVSLLVVCSSLAMAAIASAAPGNYDRSFGEGGVAHVKSFESGYAEREGRLAVGPEGATYLLRCVGGCGSRTVVTRFLPDGKIDRSYGDAGTATATTGIEGNSSEESALAVDPDGRVVVAAVLRQGLVLTRLNPDGSVDGTFSGGGVERRIECGCVGLHLAIDGAGRIVVDGRSTVTDNGESQYALPSTSTLFFSRFLSDGRPDPGFGENGATIVTLEGVFTPQSSIVQSDGGIVIAGSKRLHGIWPFALRIEPNGSFQRLYGAALMKGPLNARLKATGATALIARPNGVRVLGETESGGGYVLALGAQGKVSHSFGEGGFRLLPWKVTSAAGDRQGRIVGVGTQSLSHHVTAFRLLANGAPDRTFAGGRGVLLMQISEMESAASEQVVIPPNQRPTFLVSTVDFCRFQCGADQTLFRLRGGDADARCRGQVATVVGTVADDRLVGTPRRDVIVGLSGADVVYGRGGNDLICGGPGQDQLHGGPGRDHVYQ